MSSYIPSPLSSSLSSSSSSSSSYSDYYLPTTGFAIGSPCNVDENMCLIGSECKKSNLFGWSAVCQPINMNDIVSSTTSMSSVAAAAAVAAAANHRMNHYHGLG